MKHLTIAGKRDQFLPLLESKSVQAALMVLKPGESSSDEVENEHPKSEQWLYVISGIGRTKVGDQTAALKEGSLLLIEKREKHKITNTGRSPLVTINFYAPPAYTRGGSVRRQAGE